MSADYIPQSNKNLRDWLQIQKNGTPAIATAVGMHPDEQTAFLGAIEELLGGIVSIVDLSEQLDHKNADFQALLAAKLPLLRQTIRRAKLSSGCTPGVAQQMGWIGGNNATDPASSQPTITVTVQPGRVKVEGRKPGFQAANLYMRRKGETEWKLIAIRKRKFPIYDDTPLATAGVPEVREYRAVGVVDDEELGQPSVAVEVAFTG